MGMTKRELFAAMAIAGILAHHNSTQEYLPEMTKAAVEVADAMIAELNKQPSNER